MTDTDLEAIEKACAAATAGPWTIRRSSTTRPDRINGIGAPGDGYDAICCADSGVYGPSTPDAEFIIGARQWVPELLAEVKRLREELAALSEAAIQADLYCWGPCYDRERAPAVIHQLRVLSQPNRQRDNAAWVLLDQIRTETRAMEREACAKLAEHYEPPDEDSSIADDIAAAIRDRKP